LKDLSIPPAEMRRL